MAGPISGFNFGAKKTQVALELVISSNTEGLTRLKRSLVELKAKMAAVRAEIQKQNADMKEQLAGAGKDAGRRRNIRNQYMQGINDKKKEMAQMKESAGLLQRDIGMRSIRGSQMSEGLKKTKEGIKENSRFKMEWLGLMFAGMALMKVFGGYIGQVSEMVGITSILTTIMTLLLLPALLPLVDHFINLLTWVSALSEEERKSIGTKMLWVTAIGAVVFIVSSMALALNSLIGLMNSMAPVFGPIVGLFGKLGSALFGMGAGAGLVAVIIAGTLTWAALKLSDILSGLTGIMQDEFPIGLKIAINFLQLLRVGVEAVLIPFRAMYHTIKGIWDILNGKDWKSVSDEMFGNVFGGLGKSVSEAGGGLWNTAKSIGGGLKNLVGLADGGIVTRPTLAMVGESGPEAVVPLNRINNISPSVTINANVSSNVDVDFLARRVSSIIAQDMRYG